MHLALNGVREAIQGVQDRWVCAAAAHTYPDVSRKHNPPVRLALHSEGDEAIKLHIYIESSPTIPTRN